MKRYLSSLNLAFWRIISKMQYRTWWYELECGTVCFIGMFSYHSVPFTPISDNNGYFAPITLEFAYLTLYVNEMDTANELRLLQQLMCIDHQNTNKCVNKHSPTTAQCIWTKHVCVYSIQIIWLKRRCKEFQSIRVGKEFQNSCNK